MLDENGDFIQDPYYDGSPYPDGFDGAAQDRAAAEYYGQPGSQTQAGPNNFVNNTIDISGHDPVNWYDPGSYQYLINTPSTATPGPGAPAPPTSTAGGGGSGGGGSIGSLGFTGPTRPTFNFSAAPTFTAPTFAAPDPFKAPNAEDVLNDPGYGFRLGQGRQALEQSAAGKGVLRTGGTLKDILGYGQSLASQEYSNVYGRAADSYDRNYGVSRDVFDRTYQGAKDTYAPTFSDWQMRQNAEQRAGELEFARQWDMYTYGTGLTEAEKDRELKRQTAALAAGTTD